MSHAVEHKSGKNNPFHGQPLPLSIAVYISGHGYGHLMRTLNLLSILSTTRKYKFHIRTTSPLYEGHLDYALHSAVIQTNEYQIGSEASLQSLQNFDILIPAAKETQYLVENSVRAILSDAPSLPCLLAQSLNIPSILVTNFTFDSIYQQILSSAPAHMDKKIYQAKIDEMSREYGLAKAVIRLPGYIPFLFTGPKIIDAPMHFRKAILNRADTLAGLGLQHLADKKILLHSFGGHIFSNAQATNIPKLPEGWVCLSQTIDAPPPFYKISRDVFMPDIIGASDVVLGKMGWGTCSEVIGNGYKPFIYVPRSAFMEEVGLLEWMEKDHRRVVRFDVEGYESMDWREAVLEAEKMGEKEVEVETDWVENDRNLVRIFEDTLDSVLVPEGGK